MCLTAVCQALCCFGSSLCNCCCTGLNKCGIKSKAFPKVAYVVIDFLTMFMAFLTMYIFHPWAKDSDWLECNDSSGGGHQCFGTAAVIRASFVLFIFHILILLMLIPRGDCSSAIHDGFFTCKFLMIFAGWIASFWIHNDFFIGWANFCRGGSIIYLFMQSYFLLNHAYLWNDKLVKEMESGAESCYAGFLLCGFSIILAIISMAWIGLQIYWFHGCTIGIITIVVTILFFIFYFVVALLPLCDVVIFRKNATIFVVGISTIYVTYLSWTALASHPDKECNAMIDSGWNTTLQILVGAGFTFANIWSIAIASAENNAGKEKETMGQAIIEEDEEVANVGDEKAALFVVTFQTMFFQGVMVLVSLYFGMLWTNWGHAVIDNEVDNFAENAHFSVWAKLVTQYLTIILFTISVTLTVCCTDRII